MRKGFFQLGIVIIVASVFAGSLIVNKLKFNSPTSADACSTNKTSTTCNKACSPEKANGESFKCTWSSVNNECRESGASCSGGNEVPQAPGNDKNSCEGNNSGNYWCNGCGGFCLSGSYTGGGCIQAEAKKCPGGGGGYGQCSSITGAVEIYYCKGKGQGTQGCQRKDPLPAGVRWDSVNKRIVGSFCGTVQVDQIGAAAGTKFCSHYDESGCETKNPPTSTPKPTPSPTPKPTPTKSPTPKPTKSPVVTKSPSPSSTQSPVPQCNSKCTSDNQCPSGLSCYKKYGFGTGYCRNMNCNKQENCICNQKTPTPTPTITPTVTPSPTSKSEVSKLVVCKYKDENGNGNKDGEDKLISWKFNYNDGDSVRSLETAWWNVFRKGCSVVNSPVNKTITVNEEGKSGWELTAVYADNQKVSGGNYIYNSEAGKTKEVWFLNKQNPLITQVVGEPNSCNGTCGSNINCQSGLYCHQGYCRKPECPNESSCGCPNQVLSASAPPVLPKTGGNFVVNLFGMVSISVVGIYLFRKFRLV